MEKLDSGEWEYRLGDKVHRDYSLKNLEFIVRMHGLKWGVLDEKLANESLKEDELVNTGFLNVYISKEYGGDKWCYRGSDLKSKDLLILKKRVMKSGLEWKITNQEAADKSLELNSRNFNMGKVRIRESQFNEHLKEEKTKSLNLRSEIKREKKSNYTGFFRVNLRKGTANGFFSSILYRLHHSIPCILLSISTMSENFFLDNSDLQFHFEHTDLADILRMREDDFTLHTSFPEAPASLAEAQANCRSKLDLVGKLSGEEFATETMCIWPTERWITPTALRKISRFCRRIIWMA